MIHNWSARVSCKKFELGGSFTVFVFLGQAPTNPKDWMTDPAFAGIFGVFALVFADTTPEDGQTDLVVKGLVPLNNTILKLSKQSSLESDFVVHYLKERIDWAIVKNGSVVPVTALPSLEVIVREIPLTRLGSAKYPTPGQPTYYPEIGRGKPGGPRETLTPTL